MAMTRHVVIPWPFPLALPSRHYHRIPVDVVLSHCHPPRRSLGRLPGGIFEVIAHWTTKGFRYGELELTGESRIKFLVYAMDLEVPNVVLQMLNVWMGALPTRSWRNFETFAILTGNSWKYWHTELAVE